MDVVVTVGILLLLAAMIRGFAKFSWRESEREYRDYKSRRGEDEDPDRPDPGRAPGSHWGGWGRPG